MIKCPLSANEYGHHPVCMQCGCALWDGKCLIAAALKTYINEHTLITSYEDDYLAAMNFGILPSNEGDIL